MIAVGLLVAGGGFLAGFIARDILDWRRILDAANDSRSGSRTPW